MKTNFKILTVVILVFLGTLLMTKERNETVITHNNIEITIVGETFEQDLYNDTVYVYVPINTKLDETTIHAKSNKTNDNKEIVKFLNGIDTLIPGETKGTVKVNGEELNISVIVE